MKGRRILVTASDGARLSTLLRAHGALPLAVPTITVRPRRDPTLDAALAKTGTYDWIVLTSPNGVELALARLEALGLRVPTGPRWAAVGPRTGEALEAAGIRVDHVPDDGRGAAIPSGMGAFAGKSVLLLRAAAAGDDLPRLLAAGGARVDDVAVYETIEGPESARAPLAAVLRGGVDAAIFTSGSTVRGFIRLAPGGAAALGGAAIACIGPATARAARAAGFVAPRVALDRTPAALLAALRETGPGARA